MAIDWRNKVGIGSRGDGAGAKQAIDWGKVMGLAEQQGLNTDLLSKITPGSGNKLEILGKMGEDIVGQLKPKMDAYNKSGPSASSEAVAQNAFMSQYMDEMRRQRELQEAEARRRREMYNRLTGILDSYELSDEEKMRVASKREELRGRVVEDYKRQFDQSLAAQTRVAESEAAARGISGGLARKGERELRGKHLGQVASMRAQMPLQVADDVRAFEQDYRQMLNDKSKTALGMFGSAGEGALGYAKNIGAGLSDLSRQYMDESQFNRQRADQRWYWDQQVNQWGQERADANKPPGFWDVVGNVGGFLGNVLPW